MIELIIFILILAATNVAYEWSFPVKEISGYKVFHGFSFVRDILIVSMAAYFSLYPVIENPANIWAVFWIAGTFYWIAFDLLWNLFFDRKWYYVGSGGMDLIFGNWTFFLKIIGLFVSSFILLQYYG